MITTDGVVKILDFGLAKSFGDRRAPTCPSRACSSARTRTCRRSRPAPARSTIAAISSRSARSSTRCSPARARSTARAAWRRCSWSCATSRRRCPIVASHVPAPLRWIVDRCLSKDPEDRYVSTRDLARDLQYLRDHFSEAGTATPIREKDSLATRIRKRWPVAAAIVFALVAGSLVTAWVRRPEPRTITSERYLTYSGHDYSPAVSPDGKLIAFASSRDGEQRIWLKQVAGGSEVALTAGSDDFPRFSPDSSAILYIHAEPARARLALARPGRGRRAAEAPRRRRQRGLLARRHEDRVHSATQRRRRAHATSGSRTPTARTRASSRRTDVGARASALVAGRKADRDRDAARRTRDAVGDALRRGDRHAEGAHHAAESGRGVVGRLDRGRTPRDLRARGVGRGGGRQQREGHPPRRPLGRRAR